HSFPTRRSSDLLGGGANVFNYVGGNPVGYIDHNGLAYFGKRPLGGLPAAVAKASQSNIDNALNTELVHEQIFFEDGKPESNLGFFGDNGIWNEPGTVGPDDPELLKEYWRSDPRTYDDALMREAVDNVGEGNYCLIGSNCQDWADKVRWEYEKLLRERKCP